jgi:hypothetical protein
MITRLSRRQLLASLAGVGAAGSLGRWLTPTHAFGQGGRCERVIFFYHPDGVPGPSANGEPSAWHASGSERQFTVPEAAGGIRDWQSEILFFRGLSMGATDSGSHPGGAKKLLTAKDGGGGESIDHWLSHTAGADMPWRHLHLGAMAAQNNASGDKFITYPSAGVTLAPQDDPRRAFADVFGVVGAGQPTGDGAAVDPRQRSLLDHVLGDLGDLQARLGNVEKSRLDYHLQSVRELELRLGGAAPVPVGATCDAPVLDTGGFTDDQRYDAAKFGEILRAQMDLTVLAMACGLTRVATIQASQHTSELIMSRIPGSSMYDPNFDMRSHQASHYGPAHDAQKREYADYVRQRQWFGDQFAYLLDALAARPEGDGTMLDHSLVVYCTEVCDGNTHLHDDMPLLLAGRAGGLVEPGRLLQFGWEHHGKLWAAVARAMGQDVDGWGDGGGVLSGVLTS